MMMPRDTNDLRAGVAWRCLFGSTLRLAPYNPSMDKRLPPSKLALMRGNDDDDEDGDANRRDRPTDSWIRRWGAWPPARH